MAKYGSKAWAKWAKQNVNFALILLKEPDKQWDKETSQLQTAIKSLNILHNDLQEVSNG